MHNNTYYSCRATLRDWVCFGWLMSRFEPRKDLNIAEYLQRHLCDQGNCEIFPIWVFPKVSSATINLISCWFFLNYKIIVDKICSHVSYGSIQHKTHRESDRTNTHIHTYILAATDASGWIFDFWKTKLIISSVCQNILFKSKKKTSEH